MPDDEPQIHPLLAERAGLLREAPQLLTAALVERVIVLTELLIVEFEDADDLICDTLQAELKQAVKALEALAQGDRESALRYLGRLGKEFMRIPGGVGVA